MIMRNKEKGEYRVAENISR